MITTRKMNPRYRNALLTPTFLMSCTAIGVKTNAPNPNPATVIPTVSPFLSGNHLIVVTTGVTYPKATPAPPMTPYVRKIIGTELTNEVRINPVAMIPAPIMVTILGPTLSCSRPA